MQYRSAMAALALLAALCAAPAQTLAWNETSYPDFKGQWRAIGARLHDDNPLGRHVVLRDERQRGFACDDHKVSERVEKLAQPQIATATA